MIQEETISAISTARGSSAIGIVRMSGSRAIEIADKIFKSVTGKRLKNVENHKAIYGKILDIDEKIIDECLILVMRSPNSYTKEDVVEIQCHGSVAALEKVMMRTLEEGARIAERGEFTKRAFLNGRIDLSQAEAVMDIIQAKTTEALRVAEDKLSGKTNKQFSKLKQQILDIIAHIEALIEYPEDDIEEMTMQEIERAVNEVLKEVEELLRSETEGKILREGIETAIIGKPNVGKSSLLNIMSQKEKAIVTEIAGTTRDTIEEYVNIKGVPLKIIDTAGIRNSDDRIEQIGIERSKRCAEQADLILALFDVSHEITEEDEEILRFIEGRNYIVVLNKVDLPNVDIKLNKYDPISISIKNKIGIENLYSRISENIKNISSELKFVKNAREIGLLKRIKNHIIVVKEAINLGVETDLISIDLRSALEELSEMTGETVSEDIVNEIFSKFCVGK